MSYWEVAQATDLPLKLFVHALDANGTLVSQWDGLSIDPTALQPGDRFLQFHQLPVPSTDPARLVLGVYDGDTLERLRLPDGVMREFSWRYKASATGNGCLHERHWSKRPIAAMIPTLEPRP